MVHSDPFPLQTLAQTLNVYLRLVVCWTRRYLNLRAFNCVSKKRAHKVCSMCILEGVIFIRDRVSPKNLQPWTHWPEEVEAAIC